MFSFVVLLILQDTKNALRWVTIRGLAGKGTELIFTW